MTEWTKYRELDGGVIHLLSITETDCYMKVEKTRGGDYSVTCLREGDICGGEVDYSKTLAKAKMRAEAIVKAGEYEDYLY